MLNRLEQVNEVDQGKNEEKAQIYNEGACTFFVEEPKTDRERQA